MILFDTPTLLSNGKLSIPEYHRGPTSLKSGTEVTLCLLPADTRHSIPPMAEFVVSPIHFDSWEFLTRISAMFRDAPGVVSKLLTCVAEAGLNIVYEESAPSEMRDYHRIEILADGRHLYDDHSAQRRNDPEALLPLERRLKARCLRDVVYEGTRPRIKVRPVYGLRNAWRECRRKAEPHPTICRVTVSGGQIEIPQSLLDRIRENQKSDGSQFIVTSDTKERLLRVFVLPEELGMTYVRIYHRDLPGSAAAIADALADTFTNIASLSRLKSQGRTSSLEFLLHSPNYPNRNDDDKRKAIIESALAVDKLSHLDIHVSYPPRVGSVARNAHKPELLIADGTWNRLGSVCSLESPLADLNTGAILSKRIKDLTVEKSKETDIRRGEQLRQQRDAASDLLLQEGEELPLLQVFVSFHFDHARLRNAAFKRLEECDCSPTTGEYLAGGAEFQAEILQRIKQSHGLCSIWQNDKQNKFPPWLLWELGVAQAHQLPFLVFVHNDVDPDLYTRINPAKLYVPFSSERKFRTLLEREVPQFVDRLKSHWLWVARSRRGFSWGGDGI